MVYTECAKTAAVSRGTSVNIEATNKQTNNNNNSTKQTNENNTALGKANHSYGTPCDQKAAVGPPENGE